MEEFNDCSPNSNNSHYHHGENSRPHSVGSSSGFASVLYPGDLNGNMPKEYLLSIIDQLEKELRTKERRISDLEDYTGRLLTKIIDKYPDILQVN